MVTDIAVDVADASPACGAAELHVSPPPGDIEVAAGEETTVHVEVALADSAPDSCQGAAWPLRYTATAARS